MANLYYHRMMEGFPDRLYSSVSYAAGYSKRAFVLTTLEQDDHVIVDPTEGMDLSFPDLTLLNEQGLGPRPENVHTGRFDHYLHWSENLERNRELIEKLESVSFDYLFPFTGKSRICHALAERLGIPVRTSDSRTSYWAEDKKTLLEMEHLSRVPAGCRVNDNTEIARCFSDLQNNPGFPGKMVLKAAQSASGTVSAIIETEAQLLDFIKEFDFSQLDGGVLEEWHESDMRSPSINYFIYPDGRSKILFISNQIFEDSEIVHGKEGTRIYRGNAYPTDFDRSMREKIVKNTRPLVDELFKRGYWGPVGFDTIVVNGSDNYVTEINPRITGPHFGWRPMKNLGLSSFTLQNEKINPDEPFGKLRKTLEDILYYKGKSGGYVIFNFFPGKFIGLSLGSSPEEAAEIREKSTRLIKKLNGRKN
jgi:hypothetical protein